MPIIAVVRPGCTDFDVHNRIQGNLDLPLNDEGRSQLANSISQLVAWPLEAVYTATTDPARSTADGSGQPAAAAAAGGAAAQQPARRGIKRPAASLTGDPGRPFRCPHPGCGASFQKALRWQLT